MSSIVSVQNLTKTYKELTAVNDLSFTVRENDVYGFLGQNGAGKSTTIRMLLSLIKPTSGKIEMFGLDLNTHRREILNETGAVIEKPDLYDYLTAYENLLFFARLSGIRPSRKFLMDQMEMVGIHHRAQSKVKTFSQGMKQRLGIAIALVHNPKLIILDEPVNGLDPQGIADIRNLILKLSRQHNKTILVSSHLLSEIELIASRILIIDKGKKIIEADAKELLDPAHTILEVKTNEFESISKIPNQWKGFIQSNDNANLIFNLDKSKIPELIKDLTDAGVSIVAAQSRTSLENYFISVTSKNQHVEPFTT